MPITPTNQSKNTTTYSTTGKVGVTLWSDVNFSWDSSSGYWDVGIPSFSNETKHSITPTNVSKS